MQTDYPLLGWYINEINHCKRVGCVENGVEGSLLISYVFVKVIIYTNDLQVNIRRVLSNHDRD